MCLTLWRNVRPVGRPHLCDRCIHHPDGEAGQSSTTRPRLTRRSVADCAEKTRRVEPPPHSRSVPRPPTPPRSPPLPTFPPAPFLPRPGRQIAFPQRGLQIRFLAWAARCNQTPTAAGRGSPASPGSPRARSQEPLGKLSAGKVPAIEGGLPIRQTPIKKTKTPGDGWWPTAVKQPQ